MNVRTAARHATATWTTCPVLRRQIAPDRVGMGPMRTTGKTG